jgi:hypothetical protein
VLFLQAPAQTEHILKKQKKLSGILFILALYIYKYQQVVKFNVSPSKFLNMAILLGVLTDDSLEHYRGPFVIICIISKVCLTKAIKKTMI